MIHGIPNRPLYFYQKGISGGNRRIRWPWTWSLLDSSWMQMRVLALEVHPCRSTTPGATRITQRDGGLNRDFAQGDDSFHCGFTHENGCFTKKTGFSEFSAKKKKHVVFGAWFGIILPFCGAEPSPWMIKIFSKYLVLIRAGALRALSKHVGWAFILWAFNHVKLGFFEHWNEIGSSICRHIETAIHQPFCIGA